MKSQALFSQKKSQRVIGCSVISSQNEYISDGCHSEKVFAFLLNVLKERILYQSGTISYFLRVHVATLLGRATLNIFIALITFRQMGWTQVLITLITAFTKGFIQQGIKSFSGRVISRSEGKQKFSFHSVFIKLEENYIDKSVHKMDILGNFLAHFYKGDSIWDLLFAFLHTKLLLKEVYSKRKEFAKKKNMVL